MRDYNNGVTPRARSYPKFCEASPPKMRGVTPKNARRHPNTCEESPRKWRDGPSPVFPKLLFSRSKPAKGTGYSLCMKVIWDTTITEEQTIPAPPVSVFLCYCKCGENGRSHPDRRYIIIGECYQSDCLLANNIKIVESKC